MFRLITSQLWLKSLKRQFMLRWTFASGCWIYKQQEHGQKLKYQVFGASKDMLLLWLLVCALGTYIIWLSIPIAWTNVVCREMQRGNVVSYVPWITLSNMTECMMTWCIVSHRFFERDTGIIKPWYPCPETPHASIHAAMQLFENNFALQGMHQLSPSGGLLRRYLLWHGFGL